MEVLKYGLSVKVKASLEDAEKKVREALGAEGFGVLTEIDVAATLKAKLGLEREPYKILGACNPNLAHQALDAEEYIGLLLPCNVVVYAKGGETVVAALEPLTMLQLTSNSSIEDVARDARARLERALEAVEKAF